MTTTKRKRALRMVALITLLCILAGGWFVFQTDRSSAAPSASPAVRFQVLNVDCTSSGVDIGSTYKKIQDIGNFSVQSPQSFVEVDFNGRLRVKGTTGTGVVFEIRVDNQPSPIGRARVSVRSSEANNDGMQSSMTGVFKNLSTGNHTLSLWAKTALGAAENIMADPGCWGTDHTVIKEYLPFGAAALPVVLGE